MENVSLTVIVQGFLFSSATIGREISWVHLKLGIGETSSVFTHHYELNDQECGIVDRCTKDVQGLRFKRYSDSTGLWINNVKDYFIQLHNLYGGTFAMKGGGYPKSTFEKWGIPITILGVPRCVRIFGPGCSMYRCLFYKNYLSKNVSQ